MVPKGCFGGDVEGAGVLKLRLGLLDVCVEGYFFLLVKLFSSGMYEVVEGYLNEDMTERGVRRGLEDKAGEGAEVVLKGGSGLGYVVLIDSVERGGPRDGGRRHWRQGSVSSCY